MTIIFDIYFHSFPNDIFPLPPVGYPISYPWCQSVPGTIWRPYGRNELKNRTHLNCTISEKLTIWYV